MAALRRIFDVTDPFVGPFGQRHKGGHGMYLPPEYAAPLPREVLSSYASTVAMSSGVTAIEGRSSRNWRTCGCLTRAVVESASTLAGARRREKTAGKTCPCGGIADDLAFPAACLSPDRIPAPPPARRSLGPGQGPRARPPPRPPSPLSPSRLRGRTCVWLRPVRIRPASRVRAKAPPRLAAVLRQRGTGRAGRPGRRRRWRAHKRRARCPSSLR